MTSVGGLATNSVVTAVENKILDVISLVKKQIMMQKLVTLKRKLLIIIMINVLLLQNLIKLGAKRFAARLAQANLVTKTDFYTKLTSINKKK